QTLNRLVLLQCDPLTEVASFALPSLMAPAQTALATHPKSSRLATVDADDHSISVWRVDFAGLLKAAAITRRTYATAGVAMFGEPETGRTNLALALTGGSFNAELTSHGFEVHRLRLDSVQTASAEVEIRDVAIWDLPS